MFDVKYIHLFGTGRAALYYLLKSYNRPGGVIIPSYTNITVPEAVQFAGYYPVFVDVNYPSLDMDLNTLRGKIKPDVRAIIAIHTFGLPCNVGKIREIARNNNLLFIEDTAPAFGAEYQGQIVGSFGDASILSFNHGKVLSGEAGGALITNDDELEQAICRLLKTNLIPVSRSLSFGKALLRKMITTSLLFRIKVGIQIKREIEILKHGITPKKVMPALYSKECSPISSSLVLQQMDNLKGNLSRRRRIGQIYQNELAGLPWVTMLEIPDYCSPAWIQFSVFVEEKIDFYYYMYRHGIDLSLDFPYSVAESFGEKEMPNSRRVVDTIIGFPTYPSLTDSKVKSICNLALKYPYKNRLKDHARSFL